MDSEIRKKINRIIDDSDFILAGVGEELDASYAGEDDQRKIRDAYDDMVRMFRGKPYFVLTQNPDHLIFESKITSLFISAPYCTRPPEYPDQEKQWNSYLNWLGSAPSKKACLMLLGVGIMQPQLIRWPFEKTAKIAQKSHLITVHHSLAFLPEGLDGRGTAVRENAADFAAEMISGS